jgi:hypothetical protein
MTLVTQNSISPNSKNKFWKEKLGNEFALGPTTKAHCLYIYAYVVCFPFEMSQTTMRATMHLAPLETPQWIGVHLCSFVLFKPTLWELLNIELFFHWKLNKIFLLKKKGGELGCSFGIVGKCLINRPNIMVVQVTTFQEGILDLSK